MPPLRQTPCVCPLPTGGNVPNGKVALPTTVAKTADKKAALPTTVAKTADKKAALPTTVAKTE